MSADRASSDPYYVGLYKGNSGLGSSNLRDYWLDGSDSTYRSYKSGEPDDDDSSCYIIKGDTDGLLEDHDCDSEEKYICKRASS